MLTLVRKTRNDGPRTLAEWEAEWHRMLDDHNKHRRQLRESGEQVGISEDMIVKAIHQLDDAEEIYRRMFKTAWFLWAGCQWLITPAWRKKKRAEYKALASRLEPSVLAALNEHRSANSS